MPGYHLIEFEPAWHNEDALPARPMQRLGFLDFLRELNTEEPDPPRFWLVTVTGLEEVLFAAGPEAVTIAAEICRRLRTAAPFLHRRLADVYVLFRGKLNRGDDLWSEYRGMRLPIGHIFGAPPPQTGPDGRRYYSATFNLTHGG